MRCLVLTSVVPPPDLGGAGGKATFKKGVSCFLLSPPHVCFHVDHHPGLAPRCPAVTQGVCCYQKIDGVYLDTHHQKVHEVCFQCALRPVVLAVVRIVAAMLTLIACVVLVGVQEFSISMEFSKAQNTVKVRCATSVPARAMRCPVLT